MEPKVDSYGNDPDIANFENEIARGLLAAEFHDTLKLVNGCLLTYVEGNKKIFPNMLYNELLSILKEVSPNIAKCVNAHKVIFEKYCIPNRLDDLTKEAVQKSTLTSLRLGAQAVISQQARGDNVESANKLISTLRDSEQFGINRGRVELKEAKQSDNKHFGITDDNYTPFWAKDYHLETVKSAKNYYEFNNNSSVVSFYRKNKLPLISGPSGTLSFILQGLILLNIPLSLEQTREYIATLTAGMIAEGHHSIAEVVMVACNLNLYRYRDAQGIIHPLKFPFDSVREMYQQFLPQLFKNSKCYEEIIQKYPEYLPVSSVSSKHCV